MLTPWGVPAAVRLGEWGGQACTGRESKSRETGAHTSWEHPPKTPSSVLGLDSAGGTTAWSVLLYKRPWLWDAAEQAARPDLEQPPVGSSAPPVTSQDPLGSPASCSRQPQGSSGALEGRGVFPAKRETRCLRLGPPHLLMPFQALSPSGNHFGSYSRNACLPAPACSPGPWAQSALWPGAKAHWAGAGELSRRGPPETGGTHREVPLMGKGAAAWTTGCREWEPALQVMGYPLGTPTLRHRG